MTKSELRIGDMVETRNGKKYIVTSNNKLSSLSDGFMNLMYYDENLLLNKYITNEYGNDNYDIVKAYQTDEYGNYKCVWERPKDEMATKEYVINSIDNDMIDETFTIKPNNTKGYKKSISGLPIFIERNDDEDACLALSLQGAKDTVKALNEIIEYLEK